MEPWPKRETISLAELAEAVDVDALRDLIGRGSRQRQRVSRAYAVRVATTKGFPDPILDHPKLRLWHRADVEQWLDLNRPTWRGDT